MCKFRIVLTLLLLSMAGVMMAAPIRVTVVGRVCELGNHEDLIGSTVKLLTLPDSLPCAMTTAQLVTINGDKRTVTSEFDISIPDRKRSYLVEISCQGYEKRYLSLTPQTFGKSQRVELPLIELARSAKVLDEVSVNASTVRFLHKGDTIVFNAAAFRLPEGSMLDALVKQLPGVELKSNGEILYNGEHVKSLLLDGKYFFQGNNQVMLQNLGAYTVKDIKIYDKASDDSEFAGRKITSEQNLVMDVKLKKEFSSGIMANFQVGYGTSDKYLGRAFGMLFNNEKRVAAYGNVNNLGDERKPGESDNWSPASMATGENRMRKGGLDYNIERKSTGFKVNGNLQGEWLTKADERGVYSTNFLPQGSVYDRSASMLNKDNMKLSTNHELYYKNNRFNLTLRPTLTYNKNKDKETNGGLTSKGDIQGLGFGDLTSGWNASETPNFVNHYLSEWLKDGNKLEATLMARSNIKLGQSGMILNVGADGSYGDFSENEFSRYRIDYADKALSGANLHRYVSNKPNRDYRAEGRMGTNISLTESINLDLSYRYSYELNEATSELYNLHQLSEDNGGDLGWLPSMTEYKPTFDAANSYESTMSTRTNTLVPFFVFGKGGWGGQLVVPVKHVNRHLNYKRGDINADFSKNTVLFDLESTFLQWRSKDRSQKYQLFYSRTTKLPSMIDFVDMRNDVDPLNIYVGNDKLSNAVKHRVSLSWEGMNMKRMIMQTLKVGLNVNQNALAKSMTYDPTSGIRTYRTENVKGNWALDGLYGFGFAMGRKGMVKLGTQANYVNSVDLIGEGLTPRRNNVVTRSIGEIIMGDYSWLNHKFGIDVSAMFNNYTGENLAKSFNVFDQRYGFNADFRLTEKLNFVTDFTIYDRRGFDNRSYDATNYVWNARVSYSMMRGRMLLMVDGFDIFRNLRNVTYTVNAQGRTETYLKVVPNYYMISLQYRFSRQPKK